MGTATNQRRHAVVLGGDLAGLLAARVLSRVYQDVVVVHRDRVGSEGSGLLPGGLAAVETLLPGITDELVTGGAVPVDISGEVRWHLGGRRLRQTRTGLTSLSVGRSQVEAAVRRRVRGLDNVVLLDGYDIEGIAALDRRVVGARLAPRRRRSGASLSLPANLVVDATGRSSRTPLWLEALGYPVPAQDWIRINLTSVTNAFRGPQDVFGDDVVVATGPAPCGRAGAVLRRTGDGRTLVTLTAFAGERPPTLFAGFLDFSRRVATPDAARFLETARPIATARSTRTAAYARHRYEHLDEFPAGLVVLGDAVCCFNPGYGQGLSVAAMSALVLADELRHDDGPDFRRYFRTLAALLDTPWNFNVGTDLASAEDHRLAPAGPPEDLSGVLRAAADDDGSSTAFLRVLSLVDPISSLRRPA